MRPSFSPAGRVSALIGLLFLSAAASLEACGGQTEDDLGEVAASGGQSGSSTGGANGAGAGGAKAGAGGSLAGTGGSTAGVGGSLAGAGGSTGGTGGSTGGATTAGSGGAKAGTGGANTGGSGSDPCVKCANEKCSEEFDNCNANPECASASQCLQEKCFDATSAAALATCGFQQCGLTGLPPGLGPLSQCVNQQCGGSCPFASGGGQGGSGQGGAGGTSDPGAAPGKINCGPDLTCDQATNGDCCISVNGPSPSYSCAKKGQCSGGFISVAQPCDGPEDCGDKQVCCTKFSQGGGDISCAAACEAPPQGQAFKLCHKNDDCEMPETCQVCEPGFGFTFRVCGTECPKFGG